MASPAVQTTSEANITSATSGFGIAYPSGAAAGDLILAFLSTADSGVGPSLDDSFTSLVPSVASSAFLHCWYKQLDGSEGAAANFIFSSTKAAALMFRITGHANPATQPPEICTSLGSGTGLNPDGAAITPTGGSKDYLFVCAMRQAGEEADDDTWCNSAPTNYSGLIQKTSGTGGAAASNTSLAAAYRQLTASSEDPGTFNVDQSLDWHTYTVAIHPAAPATFPAPIPRKDKKLIIPQLDAAGSWNPSGWRAAA